MADGDKYIPNGVWLRCDKGVKPGKLTILPKTVKLYGEDWAAQYDAIPYVNIPTFGVCSIIKVCVPATVMWSDIKDDVSIMGQKAILSSSTCQCTVGGTIKIYFTRQAADEAGADAEAEQDAKEKADFWGKVGMGLLIAGAVVGAAVIIVGSGGTALAVLGAAAATGAAVGGVGGAVAGGISGGAKGAMTGFFTGAAFGALGGIATATGAGLLAGGLAIAAGGAGLASLGFLGKAFYHNPSQENGLVLVGAAAGMLAGGLTAKGISVARSGPNRYLYREDDSPYSPQGRTPDRIKSHVDQEGNLNPANAGGKGTVQDHVRGAEPRKSDSPYTSTSDERNVGKSYGDHEIRIDRKGLERDIKSGKVKDVEILKHEEVVGQLEQKRAEAQERYNRNPTAENKKRLGRTEGDIANAKRDKEVLIKGKVPAEHVKVKKKK